MKHYIYLISNAQFPANSLERIEVINNPSARYSATGTSGIINIVTKSNIKKNTFLSFGLNGSTRYMVSPWISYMFADEKFSINLYSYGYYWHYEGKNPGYSIMRNENGDTTSYQNENRRYEGDGISYGLFANGSYIFDSMNLISFWGGFYGMPFNKRHDFVQNKHEEYLSNPGIYDYTEETNASSSSFGAYAGVWYEHKFNNKGHKVSTNISGSYNKYNQNDPYKRLYAYYPQMNKDKTYSKDDKSNYFGAEVNYTLPYNKKGEVAIGASGGLLSEFSYRRNDTLSFSSSEYVLDSMRFENAFIKRSDIEGYVTVQQKFGQFTVKGGLRFQSRYFNYEVINQPEHHGRNNFIGLFPSLHLSYASKSMHNYVKLYTKS